MSNWADELTTILEKEEALLCSIAQAAVRKTDALRRGDVSGVDAIVNEEQLLSLQLETDERKRLQLLSANGMQRLTLSEAVKKAPGDSAAKLSELYDRLSTVAGEIRRVNSLNSELTRIVLDFCSKYVTPVRMTYENNGKTSQVSSGKGILDRRF